MTISTDFQDIITKAAGEQRSPARAEAFRQGTDFVLASMAEQSVDRAIGERARVLMNQLQRNIYEADRKLREFSDVSLATELLDERGKNAAAFAVCFTKSLTSAVNPTINGSGKFLDPLVQKEIARATSYAVWAYLTGSQTLPVQEQQ